MLKQNLSDFFCQFLEQKIPLVKFCCRGEDLTFFFVKKKKIEFISGQYDSHAVPGQDGLTESKLTDILSESEYVLTYEDKDGDWMLVGDVPWE